MPENAKVSGPERRANVALTLTTAKDEFAMADLKMPNLGSIVHLPTEGSIAQSGVYFLYHEGVVVYVGQSTNVLRRIVAHIESGKKKFDSFSFLPCDEHRLLSAERRYIEAFVPKYNNCFFTQSLRANIGPHLEVWREWAVQHVGPRRVRKARHRSRSMQA